MAQTDRVLRHFCQSSPAKMAALLRHALNIDLGDVQPFSGKDARLVPPELEADFLAFEGDDRVLHLEIQGYSDPTFPDRLFAYHLNAALRFNRRTVRTIAVWLRTPPASQRETQIRRGGIEISVHHIVVPELDGRALVAAGLAFIAPAAAASGLSVEELLLLASRALRDSNASAEEILVAQVAAACRGRYHSMREAMARTGVEQAIIFEDLVDIGFDQGLEKGREEGLRAGVFALADALDLAVDARRRAEIESLNGDQLGALLDRLQRLRAFE